LFFVGVQYDTMLAARPSRTSGSGEDHAEYARRRGWLCARVREAGDTVLADYIVRRLKPMSLRRSLCDLEEDNAAKIMLSEALAFHGKNVVSPWKGRSPAPPGYSFNAAGGYRALGRMVDQYRFPRSSRVLLNGDSAETVGCVLSAGGDVPEQVVFKAICANDCADVSIRIGRDVSGVAGACSATMTLGGSLLFWTPAAANRLKCGGDTPVAGEVLRMHKEPVDNGSQFNCTIC
jgi:hypothetical protein